MWIEAWDIHQPPIKVIRKNANTSPGIWRADTITSPGNQHNYQVPRRSGMVGNQHLRRSLEDNANPSHNRPPLNLPSLAAWPAWLSVAAATSSLLARPSCRAISQGGGPGRQVAWTTLQWSLWRLCWLLSLAAWAASGPREVATDGGDWTLIQVWRPILCGGLGGQGASARSYGETEQKLGAFAPATATPLGAACILGVSPRFLPLLIKVLGENPCPSCRTRRQRRDASIPSRGAAKNRGATTSSGRHECDLEHLRFQHVGGSVISCILHVTASIVVLDPSARWRAVLLSPERDTSSLMVGSFWCFLLWICSSCVYAQRQAGIIQ